LPGSEYASAQDLLAALQRGKYTFTGSHMRDGDKPQHFDLKGKVYVAPLTTVGNLPFRRLLVELGADVTCGEMAMARQLIRGSSSEWALTRRHASEKVFGIQLAGSNLKELAQAAELVSRETNADFIDLNMGCPVDDITNHGCGSALLQRPPRVSGIVDAIKEAAPTLPLGLKMRTGWTDEKRVADQVIANMKGKKIMYVMVHGRSRHARYTKRANWDYIKQECAQAAREAGVQILGNGDVMNLSDYLKALDEGSELASALLGRGALIKPWLCTEIKERRVWDISASERLDLYKKFAFYGLEHWGSDQRGVDTTRRYLLEWISFAHRYVPVGIIQPGFEQAMDSRPPFFCGRSDLETLLASPSARDWEKITEMFLGKCPEGFEFKPKHKANSW
jgi:tRNA-dihydrouridine synthase 3